jgi:hypothetical protein
MKNIVMAGLAVIATLSGSAPDAQNAQPAPQSTPPAAESPPAAAESAPVEAGLSDLASMTFGCPKAALNAAAREAAKVRSQGTYQFSFFKIVSDSHHSAFEVHFKSNYAGEKELKYCVAMYCQQGWDPKTTKTSVTLMNDPRQLPGATPHGAKACQVAPTPQARAKSDTHRTNP